MSFSNENDDMVATLIKKITKFNAMLEYSLLLAYKIKRKLEKITVASILPISNF